VNQEERERSLLSSKNWESMQLVRSLEMYRRSDFSKPTYYRSFSGVLETDAATLVRDDSSASSCYEPPFIKFKGSLFTGDSLDRSRFILSHFFESAPSKMSASDLRLYQTNCYLTRYTINNIQWEKILWGRELCDIITDYNVNFPSTLDQVRSDYIAFRYQRLARITPSVSQGIYFYTQPNASFIYDVVVENDVYVNIINPVTNEVSTVFFEYYYPNPSYSPDPAIRELAARCNPSTDLCIALGKFRGATTHYRSNAFGSGFSDFPGHCF
jgi:hypothetical protein